MSLTKKVAQYTAAASLAAGSLFYGGCATGAVEIHPEVIGRKIDQTVENVVHNAPYIAGQVIAQTNPNLTPQQSAVLYDASSAAMQANIANRAVQQQPVQEIRQYDPSDRSSPYYAVNRDPTYRWVEWKDGYDIYINLKTNKRNLVEISASESIRQHSNSTVAQVN